MTREEEPEHPNLGGGCGVDEGVAWIPRGEGGGWGRGLTQGRCVVIKLLGNAPPLGFQGPNLTLREPNATEGTTVTVTCAAGPRVQVTLDGVPAAAPGQPAHLQLNATAKDDRRTFFCNTTLEVHGVILHRNRSVQLRVLCA